MTSCAASRGGGGGGGRGTGRKRKGEESEGTESDRRGQGRRGPGGCDGSGGTSRAGFVGPELQEAAAGESQAAPVAERLWDKDRGEPAAPVTTAPWQAVFVAANRKLCSACLRPSGHTGQLGRRKLATRHHGHVARGRTELCSSETLRSLPLSLSLKIQKPLEHRSPLRRRVSSQGVPGAAPVSRKERKYTSASLPSRNSQSTTWNACMTAVHSRRRGGAKCWGLRTGPEVANWGLTANLGLFADPQTPLLWHVSENEASGSPDVPCHLPNLSNSSPCL